MRFVNLRTLSSVAILSLTVSSSEALTPSRAYAWSMEKGNLLPNWSFENFSQFWFDSAPTGFTVTSRYLAASGVPGGAKTGSYVAKVSGTSPDNNTNKRLTTESFPILPGQFYTLSFYYQASSLAGSTRPEMDFFSDRKQTVAASPIGASYTGQGAWTLYSAQFTAPANAQFAALTLAQSTTQGSGGTFYFDDVIVEESTPTTAEMLGERARITETMAFGDGLGRSLQSQTKIAPGKYLVGGTGYDDLGRPDSTFLPFPVSQNGAALNANLLSASKAYYAGGTGKGPDAGGYPFSEMLYANDPGSRVLAASAPGAAWKLTGTHTTKKGFYFTSFLLQLPADIENPSADNTEGAYRVEWMRDADSNFTLTYANQLGQVVEEIRPLTHSGSTSSWKLTATQYEYYPDGRLRRIRTPLDVQAVNYNFAEVYEFNTLGQLTSKFTPNSGLTQYWYDRSGNLRYSQDSGEAIRGQYRYRAYDEQGRLKSEGLQTLSSLTQDMADQDDYAGGTRDEEVGYIYDDLLTFTARTGYTLNAVMPYYYFFDGTHSQGRLVCAYNRNSANSTNAFTAQDKFVADFYDYDERGRMAKTLRSIQPIRDPDMKYQDGYFTYDENDRLIETYNFLNAASGTLSTQHIYAYDSLGRLSQVHGLSNQPLAQFKYYDFGPVQQVLLGGDGTGTKGTKVEYVYNIHGAVQEIRATDLLNGKIVYQDYLGYDQKSNSASTVPNPIKPRFNGTISQELYRFTNDVAALNPVRLMNYDYDGLGRMIKSDYRKNTGTQPFYSDGTVNFPILAWNTTSADESSSFNYDVNGRITGQRTGGIAAADSARYVYRPNSYQLDQVTGKVNAVVSRDMSGPGAFGYDEQGNLNWDGSKGMSIQYNWNQQPISFFVEGATFGLAEAYYDAGGNRVFSRVDDNTQVVCKYYLNMGTGMSKEYTEVLDENTLAIKSTSMTVNVFAHSQVGRLRNDGVYEFFIKNHQGSTMKTMGLLGGDPPSGGASYDYLAYGDVRKLKETGSSVTQKYTGKEHEDLTRLTYFGARWYDPELGLFMSTDPAGQYANPYSFGPGDPVNGTDPTGMTWGIFRPSKWGNFFSDVGDGFVGAGKEANEYTEKAYNKYFNDECHYETNEHCRGHIQQAVSSSNTMNQLVENCGHGDANACNTLRAIGYSDQPNGWPGSYDRKLAVYIMENGSHKIGATLTVGGGKAAPAVQYDNATIPLGVFSTGGGGGISSNEASANAAVHDYQSRFSIDYAIANGPGPSADNLIAANGYTFGVSGEVSTVYWGGGRVLGLNLQYASGNGLHLYGVYTRPEDMSKNRWFAPGVSITANYGRGNGSWAGPFSETFGGVGPVSFGTYNGGSGGWHGSSLGWGAPLWLSYGKGTLFYTPLY